MAIRTPPLYLQGGTHTAENDRLGITGMVTAEGCGPGTTELQVTQSGTPAMTVSVAAGHGWVNGTTSTTQGTYKTYNDAAVTLTIATANATLPRIDKVCLTIRDAAYAGASNDCILQVITGTAAASPTAPATPASSLVLATVAVAAAATTIVNANITDARSRAQMGLPLSTNATAQLTGIPQASITNLVSDLAAKTDLAMAKNAQTGVSYSYALADQTKLLTMSNSSANTVLVTKQATVAWAADTQLRVLNLGAGVTTLVADTGVTINNNTTLSQWGGGVLIRMSSDVWTFVPFASGVGAANFSDAATGTYTGYKYKTFSSGSGTLTVTTAGFADIIVLGAGGSSNNGAGSEGGGGGGAGGALVITNAYLPAGTLTCVVGAGGGGGQSGNTSRIGTIFYGIGGGAGGNHSYVVPGQNGGSGGGGSLTSGTGTGAVGQGNNGATGFGIYNQAFGGGGGAGGNGVSPTVSGTGGAGGAGSTTTIAGTTPTGAYVAGSYAYGGGGGGMGPSTGGAGGSGGGGAGSSGTGAGTNGTANTGGGGGGGYNTASRSQGGSGLIIVRVAV